MRIVILGCAASGKTTLARRLSERTAAPVINLDEIWQNVERRTPSSATERSEAPGKAPTRSPTLTEFRELIQQAHAAENWISDGNFAQATFDIRLPRATQIIWFERSKLFCLWNAATRVFKRGEPHRITRLVRVMKFIWNFDRVNRPKIERCRASFGLDVPVCRLRNDRAVSDFLEAYTTAAVKGS